MKSRALASLLVLSAVAAPAVSGAGAVETEGIGADRAARIALDHVARVHAELGLSVSDVADVRVMNQYRSSHTGVHHLYLRQHADGLQVLSADMTVSLLPDGTVLHAPSRFIPLARSGAATIDALSALRAAAAALDIEPADAQVAVGPATGVARETTLTAPAIARSPIPAALVYQPVHGAEARLAWNLEIELNSQAHWWNVTVDAATGALLAAIDYVESESAEAITDAIGRPAPDVAPLEPVPATDPVPDGASYRVYAWPLESPNDGERTLEVNPADPIASPLGWHDRNGIPGADYTTTQGNNVHAHADWHATGVALAPFMPDGGSSLTFDYPLDLALPPHAWKDAAVTNLFYWNNVTHDILYRYGFDEAAGNFQDHNYTGAGRSDDYVNADAQDHSFVNNANFATPPDGSNPRMQMFLWANTNRRIRDGDLDAGVVIHEYGHGVSHRLTGGPFTTSCLNGDERSGEGWSDFLAIAFTARDGDAGEDRRGLGTYVSGEPGRDSAGIRPRPYSTRFGYNFATYNEIETAAVPHGVGWVWATMLWEMYWALVDDHGFNPNVYDDWTTGGNNLAIQLVMDGMKMQPCNPGFQDQRDAILAADVALTGGSNRCSIWTAFAKRGLGYSAAQNSPASRSDGVEAFDLPPACV